MDIKLFFEKNFNTLIEELDFDLNKENSYIYYNELEEKKGNRYEYIIKNNLQLSKFNTHSPSCINLFNLLSKLNITINDSFLDIGSGKGFSLVIASLLNFNNITGVEISEKDYKISINNIKKLKLNNKINIINDNILNFNEYEKFNYFYFYNPFGSDLFEKIILNILKKNNNFYIIYKNIHQEEINILNKYNIKLINIEKGFERDYYIYNYSLK